MTGEIAAIYLIGCVFSSMMYLAEEPAQYHPAGYLSGLSLACMTSWYYVV